MGVGTGITGASWILQPAARSQRWRLAGAIPDWPIERTETPWPDAADADKVLDGNYYSHWNPSGQGPWYIIFDLVAPYTLSKISITNNGDTTHDVSMFLLEASASSDPYSWEHAVTVTEVAASSEVQEFGGFSATGRFWKLNITETYGTWQPWLREVNFFGGRAAARNIALGMPAAQSSTDPHWPGSADLAVDGNRAGYYDESDPACFHTKSEWNPWWYVDLGFSQRIGQVVMFNRMDHTWQRLDGFNVYVGDDETVEKNPVCVANQPVHTMEVSYTVSCYGLMGRYVGILLPKKEVFNLCEVEVYEARERTNLALGQPAEQSGTTFAAIASRAVDGNRDGDFYQESCTHTSWQGSNWWRVDLGASYFVDEVVVFNRQDCCSTRLDNFVVYVGSDPVVTLNSPCEPEQRVTTNQAGYPVQCRGLRGRYVGIHLPVYGSLTLCEVEVFGGLDPSCIRTLQVAGDGVDNDCDELIDEEIPNGIDDDGDGWTDEDVPAVNIACEEPGEPIGMESGFIPDESITASTEHSYYLRASEARLQGSSSWASGPLDLSQWLQVDLGWMHPISGVITQGRPDRDQWVTSYKLQHSIFGEQFTTIVDLFTGLDKYELFHSVCYKAFGEQLTFAEAERLCVDNGALLAMPHDTETDQFLIRLKNSVNPNSLFWIGLSDRSEPGLFKWNDARCPFVHVSGLAGDCASRMGTYVLTNMVSADRPVYQHLTNGQFIYATDDPQLAHPVGWYIGPEVGALHGCPAEYTHTHGRCLRIYREEATYSSAVATCAAAGGFVMMPKNSELNEVLEAQVFDESASYWVGLTDPGEGRHWIWTDGSVLGDGHFHDWKYPSYIDTSNFLGKGENYCAAAMIYHKKSVWEPTSCDNKFRFICQISVLYTRATSAHPAKKVYWYRRVSFTNIMVPQLQVDCIDEKPLGLVAEVAPNVVASSVWSDTEFCQPHNSHLYSPSGWCSGVLDNNQWLQLDLWSETAVSGVITRGRGNSAPYERVTSYKLQHSVDGNTWTTYTDGYGAEKIFTDDTTLEANVGFLEAPVFARYIRILPQTWNNHISMRVDVLGLLPQETTIQICEDQPMEVSCPAEMTLSIVNASFGQQAPFPACYGPTSNTDCHATDILPTVRSMCGGWSDWSLWSDCTVYCGSVGQQSRVRTCEVMGHCKGEDIQTRDCGDYACAEWEEWRPWNPCSITCGGTGMRSRGRSCVGKGSCAGQSYEREQCIGAELCGDEMMGDCRFEQENLCGYTQERGDDADMLRHDGSYDTEGRFCCRESFARRDSFAVAAPYKSAKEARHQRYVVYPPAPDVMAQLTSPLVSYHSVRCLQFEYRSMNGNYQYADSYSVTVYIRFGGSTDRQYALWKTSAPIPQNMWSKATVDISVLQHFVVMFEIFGKVMLDNVKFSSGICSGNCSTRDYSFSCPVASDWSFASEEMCAPPSSYTGSCSATNFHALTALEKKSWEDMCGETLCSWKIVVEKGKILSLSVTSISLEEHPDCIKDALTFYDGEGDDAPVLRRLCGNATPRTFYSTGNAVFVKFQSNFNQQYEGVVVTYSSRQPHRCWGRLIGVSWMDLRDPTITTSDKFSLYFGENHSEESCQEACKQDESCRGYSLNLTSNSCYGLLNTDDKRHYRFDVEQDHVISGFKQPCDVQYDKYTDKSAMFGLVSVGGTDNRPDTVFLGEFQSEAACEYACSLENSCQAYTWVTRTNMPDLLQKCYGRNVANPTLQQTRGKYTGIKKQQSSVLTKPTDLYVQSVTSSTVDILLVTQHQVRISCVPTCDHVTVDNINGVTFATFSELQQATSYTIYVRAFETFVESEAAVVTASTMFAAPNVTLTKSAWNTVNIRWQKEAFAWEEAAVSMNISCLRKRHGHFENGEECGVLQVNNAEGEVTMDGLFQGMDYTLTVERTVGDTLRGDTAEVSSYVGLIAPTSLSALTIGAQTVTIGWRLDSDEGPVIPTMAVHCVPACAVKLVNGSTAELSDLQAGTDYIILVWTEFSDLQSDVVTITATTLIPPPSGLQAPQLSPSSIKLSWDSPAVQPDSYQISYRLDIRQIYGGVTKVETIGASETQYELNGLTNKNQRYKFELTPVIHGREGDVLTLTVCLADTARLKDFQVEHTTTMTISVTWTSPSCIDVRSYNLCAIPVDETDKSPVCLQVDPKSSSAVLEDLIPGTLYYVNLTAQIAFVIGGTPTDVISDAVSQATVPEPPSELRVTNFTSRTVSLSWSYHGNKTDSLGHHGNVINSSSVVFTVRYHRLIGLNGTESGRLLEGWLNTVNTTAVVEGLTDDTEYLITVTASVSGMHSGEISLLTYTAAEAEWSEWQSVGSCSVTCGGGRQVRRRLCLLQDGQHVQKCEGKNKTLADVEEELLSCNNVSCPVHGGWSSWSNFTSCSASCDGGTQTRSRNCTNPTPQHGGRMCAGQPLQASQCNIQSCPETCGGGLQIRRRQCNGSSCIGEAEEIRVCHEDPCPVHGGWSIWSLFSPCTAACGHGNQTRSRNCTSPEPARGGNSCPGDDGGSGQETQTRGCFLKECPPPPEPPTWSEWSPFGPCSVSCDNGTQQRHRTCSSENCEGPDIDVQQCFPYPCYATPPVDGMWSAWSEYSPCTVTCGGGAMQRTRECADPAPVHGGRPCEGDREGLGMEVQYLACNLAACNSSSQPPDNVGMCPTVIGTNNHAWPEAAAGTTQTVSCYRGVASRRCSEHSQWEAEDFKDCVSGTMAEFVDKLNGTLEDNLIPVHTVQEMEESLAAGEVTGFGDISAAAEVIKTLSQGDLLNAADGTLSNKDRFIRGLVGSVDSLLPDQSGEFWPTSKQNDAQNHVTSLINSMDDFGSSIVNYLSDVGEDYVTVHKKSIELDAAVIPAGQLLESVTQPRPPTWGPASPDRSRITVPAEAFAEILTSYPDKDVRSIGVVTYKMMHFDKILESNNVQRHIYGNRTLNGPVLSTVIHPPPKEALLNPVIIKIHHTKMAKNPLCVYLDYDDPNRLFNPSGCEVRERRRSYTICQCFHLTAFAVLTELETPEPKVTLPTTNLPWMGQVVAMATLSITLLILLWLRTHLDTSGYLFLILTAFLLAIEVTIFVGMEKSDKWYGRYLCLGVSGLLHFLLLAVFMWMLARVLQLYRDANLAEGNAPWEKYCILGILLPLAAAAAPVILNYDDYRDMSICWLPQSHYMEYAFIAPAGFILMVSTIILGIVIRQCNLTVSKAKTPIPGFDITEDDTEKTVLLLPLVAGTWLVWSFGFHMNSLQMDIAYGVLNILQGCYIFIFCCLRSREVRVSYYRKLGIPVEKSTWASLQASKQQQAKKPVYIP
ncbi:Retinal rod rhodopsin-sensitive cGMP 3',5'-cyclic phosphodiesterase subunit delta [Branchiostoma belcheri]|nr:Retinal rod rhodopsin-sensitive cGMP 3',5'-cyclic phosphodiesterase subunit delta [Branchiostoma belcheri]